ncbi:MAG: M1 family metallopeptidase [Bacteroidota bacterium]
MSFQAKYILLLPVGVMLLFSLVSCNATKVVTPTEPEIIPMEPEVMPLMELPEDPPEVIPDWAPRKYGYKPSRTRTHDLLHTKLELSFDWDKKHILGKAHLTLKPHFYETNQLTLDAQSFDIHRVELIEGANRSPVTFTYTDPFLTITFDTAYTREDTFELWIDYTAKPYERIASGGEAITSDRGLYFIDYSNGDPDGYRQIWTQGETQSSSGWFPTIDAPNERTSQEVLVRVEDRFLTVSNGKKINTIQHEDGTRTDHWIQEQGHAPYLFALAIGEFAEVKDSWRDIEVNYYIDPEFEPYARLVFGETPDMIEFFSQKLGVDYPWDKYSQIVVQEFVSGAMENTGCVIFYDALHHNDHQHADNPHQDIIAHELFHHWFGDLVTCESWANLALNESFASYGEYLWFEHRHGREFADGHLLNDLDAYLQESQLKREPIIRFEYLNPGAMFDRHSYQKGACVLHMLRTHIGDDAFFQSLNLYLTRNAYSDVEIDELRIAFEDVTGKDLNWFFNQWFLKPGHPELDVAYALPSPEEPQVQVRVTQAQDLRYMPVYRLPLHIQLIMADGDVQRVPVTLQTQDTIFSIAVEEEVLDVLFDADQVLLGTMSEPEQGKVALMARMRYGKNFRQQYKAVQELGEYMEEDEVIDEMMNTLKHVSAEIRQEAVVNLSQVRSVRRRQVLKALAPLMEKDSVASVRREVVAAFSNESTIDYLKEKNLIDLAEGVADLAIQDISYTVQATGLDLLTYLEPDGALTKARELAKSPSSKLKGKAATLLMETKDPNLLAEVVKNLEGMDADMTKFQALESFGNYLYGLPFTRQKPGVVFLLDLTGNDTAWWIRYTGAQLLSGFLEHEEVANALPRLAEKEENDQVKSYLKMLERKL